MNLIAITARLAGDTCTIIADIAVTTLVTTIAALAPIAASNESLVNFSSLDQSPSTYAFFR